MPQPKQAAGLSSEGYDYRRQQSRATLIKGQSRRTAYDCPTVALSNGSTLSHCFVGVPYRAAQAALRRRPPLF
jgi:hypothetical protein